MCLPGTSRFCVVCLLLYVWLPATLHVKAADEGEITPGNLTASSNEGAPALDSAVTNNSESQTPEDQEKSFFITQLFEKYGHKGKISFEGFEHLLSNLGLGSLVISDHNTTDHRNNKSEFVPLHDNHDHTPEAEGRSQTDDHYDLEHDDDHDHEHDGDHDQEHEDDHDHEHDDDHEHDGDHDHEHDGDHHDHEHDSDHHDHEHEAETEHPGDHREDATATNDPFDEVEDHTDHGHVHERSVPKQDQLKSCLRPKVMLKTFNIDTNDGINMSMFLMLCPALIHQLDSGSCHRHYDQSPPGGTDYHQGEGHVHDDHEIDHDHDHDHDHAAAASYDITSIPAHVWGYSTVAVVIISLVGLLGVAVIPIMQKVFYNHLLQFLVAMAVGALSGDALLHLLPHAIQGGHNHDDPAGGHDSSAVYKGLCGLGGIYFFFFIERVLTIFTDQKRKKKNRRKQKNKKGNSFDMSSQEQVVGEKLANGDRDCDEMMMIIHPNKALKDYADDAHKEHCAISFENTTTISHQHHGPHSNHNNHNDEEEENSSMLSGSHGHSHHHCHDSVPNSISAIAWMVILGDGIHNLSDGLAIGAAFANSTTGGFSTSVAVFCHELPHEIGDFAVLLRAGMSAKQAIIYNCVSSVLCFIGMLIGVTIGNISNASLWIFAVVGGLFLYIALVDMLPEMTSVHTKKGEKPYCHLLLQCTGMLLGASIMLVIAIYEENLHSLLG